MRIVTSFAAGGLFGAGLLLSGMTDTTKVIGWLDFFGAWDPTLAFVLGGAIIPMFFAWRYAEGRVPKLGGTFPTPPEPKLDRNLIVGSCFFGFGWGLAGLCPGPAMASFTFGGISGALFMVAMIAGMAFAPKVQERLDVVGKAA